MVNTVLLSPHNDDESLFAAFTCFSEKPHIVICYYSFRQVDQGVEAGTRQSETAAAAKVLGCSYEQWSYPDVIVGPTPRALVDDIYALARVFDYCWAPAVERGGHPNHNTIGALAVAAFGPECVGEYLTYTNRGRSTSGQLVTAEPGAVSAKLRALACYESQIALASAAPHFLGPLNEYVVG